MNGVMEVPTQAGDAVINEVRRFATPASPQQRRRRSPLPPSLGRPTGPSQGEYGNHFYMIDQGCYNVFLKQAGDKPVATYRTGDSFGA